MRPLSRRSFFAMVASLPAVVAAKPSVSDDRWEHFVGEIRPVVIGHVYNVEPTLVDPALLTYQVHAGRVAEISAVRDGGVELTYLRDYAERRWLYDDFAPIPGGCYATCLAEGLVALGAPPVFLITVDAATDPEAAAGLYVTARPNESHEFAGFVAVDEIERQRVEFEFYRAAQLPSRGS